MAAGMTDDDARFRHVLVSSRDVLYQLDLRTWTYDYMSPSCERVVGLPPEAFVTGGVDLTIELAHPDDVGRVRAHVERLAALDVDDDFAWTIEYRLRRTDGEYRWISDHWTLVTGDDGAPLALVGNARDVTDQKRIEAALDERAAMLRLITDAVPALISYVDREHRYRLVNRAYETWFDVSREEIVGRRLVDVLGEAAWERVRSRVEAALAGEAVSLEAELPYARGGTRFVRADYRPDVDADGRVLGYVVLVNDITAHHTAEMRLRDAEQRAAFLADASSALGRSLDYGETLETFVRLVVPRVADWCMINVVGASGAVETPAVAHVDPARREVLAELVRRYPPSFEHEVGPMKAWERRAPELIPEVPDALLERVAHDEEHLRLMRSMNFRSYLAVPVVVGDRPVAVLSFGYTDSGRQFAADDVGLAEELARRAGLAIDNARLYREAQTASRLKDEFLATVSHELRTPLNSMLGWARLLKAGKLDAHGAERAVEVIERNVRAQVQIIEDLLDVSRIIMGKLRLDVEPLDLAPIVRLAIDSVAAAAAAKGVRVELSLDDTAPPVTGDRNRLQQVVWNLLSNAIKFTPRGGLVEVRLESSECGARVVVADTGIGIEPDFLPYVFDRFRQADSSLTRAHGGLGLGLAIVRHIVEVHGGTVSAASDGPQRGTAITVELPEAGGIRSASSGDLVRPQPPEAPSPVHIPSLTGLAVLVVDDERDTRELFATVLASAGAEVATAGSAAEALESVARSRPDVVVSDIGMPGEDGYALIERLRALEAERGGRRVPAIAVTAYARQEDRVRALAAGYQLHISKPVDSDELLVAIASLVGALGRGQ